MGKTYEALEKASRERQKFHPRPLDKGQNVSEVRSLKRFSLHMAMERYEDLQTNLFTRYPKSFLRMILFNSTFDGNGSSTAAATFAAMLARDSQVRVLLVDMNLRAPSLHRLFKIYQAPGLSDILIHGGQIAFEIEKVGPENLCVLASGSKYSGGAALFGNSSLDHFLRTIRARFDHIILAGSPFPSFPEARIICAKVDGVVLVIESGKTRRHVAVKAKKELEEAGGKILGAVLNNREYYIPDWIYNRL